MNKIKLTYFKDTGKYYDSGEYHTNLTGSDIYSEVKNMINAGNNPGLRDFAVINSGLYVLIQPEDEYGVPYLLVP